MMDDDKEREAATFTPIPDAPGFYWAWRRDADWTAQNFPTHIVVVSGKAPYLAVDAYRLTGSSTVKEHYAKASWYWLYQEVSLGAKL